VPRITRSGSPTSGPLFVCVHSPSPLIPPVRRRQRLPRRPRGCGNIRPPFVGHTPSPPAASRRLITVKPGRLRRRGFAGHAETCSPHVSPPFGCRTTGVPGEQAAAISALETALAHWKAYAASATANYRPQFLAKTRTIDWGRLTDDVRRDLEIARHGKPSHP